MSAKTPTTVRTCTEVYLPDEQLLEAARSAIDVFPANAPAEEYAPARIAVLATKFWGARASDLAVGFMERPSQALRDKILAYANKWGEFSSVRFRYSADLSGAEIRISLGRGGYYSYLGTDCLQIPKNRQTMNLQGFTVNTSDSEYSRVVVHEFGHALGCPHEHARQEIIDLLDADKVINYFMRTQGWSRQDVINQILVPLEERSLMNPSPADIASIMTYQFPGSVTRSGRPIPGGDTLSVSDKVYFGKTYPRAGDPPPPPPPAEGKIAVLVALDAAGKELARYRPQ